MLKNILQDEFGEMKKRAQDAGVLLTAGYGPNAMENLGSNDPAVVKHAIGFYKDIIEKIRDPRYSHNRRRDLFVLASRLQ